ncbi:MAG: hypothetical protein WAN04_05085, partial [Candidatus Udaeobacter sp.]
FATLREGMQMHEYSAGEVVPVSSSLYRVVHDPPEAGEHMRTFYSGECFPQCPECGTKVRYMIPSSVLRRIRS